MNRDSLVYKISYRLWVAWRVCKLLPKNKFNVSKAVFEHEFRTALVGQEILALQALAVTIVQDIKNGEDKTTTLAAKFDEEKQAIIDEYVASGGVYE